MNDMEFSETLSDSKTDREIEERSLLLAAAHGSAWMTWHIRYTENHEPLRYLSQTVKARNQNEAERKASKLLSGRCGLWQVVLPLEPCGDCDPCLGGRPDQCAICPTPNHY